MAAVLRDAKMTIALPRQLTHHCHILKTGYVRFSLKNSSISSLKKGEKPTVYPF
ncbi:hypothetical protein SAMN02746095_02928 [Acidocella aminolytica 101 = DSM 11237]|nr:hypothetical protein SAMN02746095_02928 [Acidocella aminolytica 101 = DSM 11237]